MGGKSTVSIYHKTKIINLSFKIVTKENWLNGGYLQLGIQYGGFQIADIGITFIPRTIK